MLIILSGVETIHKEWIGSQAMAALNTFTVDGYNVDFTSNPPLVTDSTGKVVYGTTSTHELLFGDRTDGSHHPDSVATVNKIFAIQKEIFTPMAVGKTYHFGNNFIEQQKDWGYLVSGPDQDIWRKFEYEWEKRAGQYKAPDSYADVLNLYNTRSYPVLVITGSFSKTFIDKMRVDLGTQNVVAVNIVRHPSAAYLIHEKPASYYADPNKAPMTPEIDGKKIGNSFLNALSLVRYSDIPTIRFEDMIANQSFSINGTTIPMPGGYTPYNQWLTNWEYSRLQENIVLDANFDLWTRWSLDIAGFEGVPQFPGNAYALLGYTALTKDQVIAPKV
jgi:hypothetical protein